MVLEPQDALWHSRPAHRTQIRPGGCVTLQHAAWKHCMVTSEPTRSRSRWTRCRREISKATNATCHKKRGAASSSIQPPDAQNPHGIGAAGHRPRQRHNVRAAGPWASPRSGWTMLRTSGSRIPRSCRTAGVWRQAMRRRWQRCASSARGDDFRPVAREAVATRAKCAWLLGIEGHNVDVWLRLLQMRLPRREL